MRCSSKKTMDILHCIPNLPDIINFAVAVAMARGFYPHDIHDVTIKGSSIHFYLLHQYPPSLDTNVHIKLSFKDWIANPEQYIKEKLKQEKRRFANDNTPNIKSKHGRNPLR